MNFLVHKRSFTLTTFIFWDKSTFEVFEASFRKVLGSFRSKQQLLKLIALNIIPVRARADMRMQKNLMFFLSCVDLPKSKEELMLYS